LRILCQATVYTPLAQGAGAAATAGLWIVWCINLVLIATKPKFTIRSLPFIVYWCYGNHTDLLTLKTKKNSNILHDIHDMYTKYGSW